MESDTVAKNPCEPVPRTKLAAPRARSKTVRLLGAVRLPIAGPYRPWARLYRWPDGDLCWSVRLWQFDRAVVRWVTTDVLRAYARSNRLESLEREVDRLVRRARTEEVP